MTPSIQTIGTAVPPNPIDQTDFADRLADLNQLSAEQRDWLREVCAKSAIKSRYTVLPDFDAAYGRPTPPSGSERHAWYAKEAPPLLHKAAEIALAQDLLITHVVGVTCTGVLAPGLEARLVMDLGLPEETERLGVNFMGCFGAFKGLAAASSLVAENPDARVLVACAELCSLHMHSGTDPKQLIPNVLFADGAACAVVSNEKGKWEILRRQSILIPGTEKHMTWESGDHHFIMGLSQFVPASILKNIAPFVDKLRGDIPLEECAFAIHPGGKAILQAVERACKLQSNQTTASWQVLENFGNMSSPTFLFVLDRVATDHPYCIGLGFGPGLSVEGLLLRRTP